MYHRNWLNGWSTAFRLLEYDWCFAWVWCLHLQERPPLSTKAHGFTLQKTGLLTWFSAIISKIQKADFRVSKKPFLFPGKELKYECTIIEFSAKKYLDTCRVYCAVEWGYDLMWKLFVRVTHCSCTVKSRSQWWSRYVARGLETRGTYVNLILKPVFIILGSTRWMCSNIWIDIMATDFECTNWMVLVHDPAVLSNKIRIC
jgi:hypothetical protein